jgi:hypothetical protein
MTLTFYTCTVGVGRNKLRQDKQEGERVKPLEDMQSQSQSELF